MITTAANQQTNMIVSLSMFYSLLANVSNERRRIRRTL